MSEINRSSGLSDKDKNKNGIKLVAVLLLVGIAALGITQCSDSSWYTLNDGGMKFNRRVVLPLFIIAVVGGLTAWFIIKSKRKDL
jgi:hypothetical protein